MQRYGIIFMTLICEALLNASNLNIDPQKEDTYLQQERTQDLQFQEDQNLQQEEIKGLQFNEDKNLQQEQTNDIQFREDQNFRQERQLGR